MFNNPRGNSYYEPYTFSQYSAFPDWDDAGGYTHKDAALVGGQRTAVILVNGDSTAGNCIDSQTSVSSALAQQMALKDGAVYKLQDPMLGTHAGTPSTAGCLFTYFGDKHIVAGKADRVIIHNHSIPGTFALDFCTPGFYSAANTASSNACRFWDRIPAACRRVYGAGLTPTVILLQFGANSANSGFSTADETAALQNIIAAYQVHAPGIPIRVALNTFIGGVLPAGSSAIRAAQASVVDGVNVFQGPDLDTLGNTNRHDGVHWNATGGAAAADLYVTNIPTL